MRQSSFRISVLKRYTDFKLKQFILLVSIWLNLKHFTTSRLDIESHNRCKWYGIYYYKMHMTFSLSLYLSRHFNEQIEYNCYKIYYQLPFEKWKTFKSQNSYLLNDFIVVTKYWMVAQRKNERGNVSVPPTLFPTDKNTSSTIYWRYSSVKSCFKIHLFQSVSFHVQYNLQNQPWQMYTCVLESCCLLF